MQHQPFLFNKDENIRMLYCEADQEIDLFFGNLYKVYPWKIFLKNENTVIEELPTLKTDSNYGNVIVECNPHLFYKNNILHLGYNAGFNLGDNTPIKYRYVTTETNYDLSYFQNYKISENVIFGSAYIGDSLFATRKTPTGDIILKNDILFEVSIPIQNIYRICPIFGRSDVFILTFNTVDSDHQSWIITTDGVPVKEITNEKEESVYKCSILNNKLVYCFKENEIRSLIEENYKVF